MAAVALCAAWLLRSQPPEERRRVAALLLFFGPIWWVIGVAPTAVAGYESPRHVYLAAAGWAMVLLGLTYYVRGRIGPRRWKRIHRQAAVAWPLAAGHSLGAGTDAGAAWFLVSAGAVVLPVATALAVRWWPAPPSPGSVTAA